MQFEKMRKNSNNSSVLQLESYALRFLPAEDDSPIAWNIQKSCKFYQKRIDKSLWLV